MTDSHEPEKMHPEQSAGGDEEIIELTDRVAGPDGSDEPIIELTEIARAAPAEIAAPAEDAKENIIELTDVVPKNVDEAEQIDDILTDETAESEEAVDTSVREETPHDEDFVDMLGVDLESGLDAPEPPAISSEAVEAAIERVVREMLSDKIDTLLRKIIEKEVSKEVERIKNLLLNEAPDMDLDHL